MQIEKKHWGIVDGKEVMLLTLKNRNGLAVSITNYGAIISAILMPDKTGSISNVVLGYETLDEYLNDPFYLGCIVGRFANRIAKARFDIDGKTYRLALNEPANNCHLHGGNIGFNKKVFDIADVQSNADEASITLRLFSPDMEEGYPGNLSLQVTYTFNERNELLMDYYATSDKATHINLTNHSYFNLSNGSKSAGGHELYINADKILEADEHYLPTGNYMAVQGTKYDFKKPRPINQFAKTSSLQYNECFVVNDPGMNTKAAELYEPESGRKMQVRTTVPGIMFYTGDGLNGQFNKSEGVCLETQFFPDTPNQAGFPTTLLRPGESWHHQTMFVFSW